MDQANDTNLNHNDGNGGDKPPKADGAQQQQNQQAAAIDYAKIQQMLEGTLSAKEDTVLKAYFKQQGLSQQEAEHAIANFKLEKAKNQPDITAIQAQAAQAQELANQAKVEKAATLAAVGLGLDVKTIPYVLKMADLSQVVGNDGEINEEALNTALSKVLEDIPTLKPQAGAPKGFMQVGAPGTQTRQQQTPQQGTVATKRWNRFNN